MPLLRLLTALLVAVAPLAQAQGAASAAAGAAAMADGEVRKVDLAQGKVTLKHGPLQSLDMPPMTMVFKVADPKMLQGLKEGDKVRFSADRINGAITVTRLVAEARNELIDIAWNADRVFERQVQVAPKKFAELCGKLGRGEQVAWSFEGSAPTDFNIHYHQGKQVVYPQQQAAMAGSSGTLVAPLDQDYCWMWTNQGAAEVSLRIRLQH